jgi:MFS family permease
MIVCGIRVMMRMALRTIGPILPLFIQTIASPDAKIASLTGTIAGLASGFSALGAVILGRLADKVGARRILLVCGTLACVLYGAQATVQTTTQLLVLRVLSGIVMGGILASVSAMQAALAPKGRYGAVYGVDTSLVAAANAISPMIGAALTASFGLTSVFVGAAVIYALATIVVAAAVPPKAAWAQEGTTEGSAAS